MDRDDFSVNRKERSSSQRIVWPYCKMVGVELCETLFLRMKQSQNNKDRFATVTTSKAACPRGVP